MMREAAYAWIIGYLCFLMGVVYWGWSWSAEIGNGWAFGLWLVLVAVYIYIGWRLAQKVTKSGNRE